MTTIPDRPALSPVFRLQWEPAQNNYVLLYPEGMVKLNRSAAEILKRCDGRHSVDDLVRELEQAFGASGLHEEVDDFLHAAAERGWLG